MAKHYVYLREELEKELQAHAKKLGISPDALFRMQVERIGESLRQRELEESVGRCHEKMDAVFALLDLVIGDIGYTAGATRAATKNHEPVVKEGSLQEERVMRTAAALKRVFRGETGGQHGV